MCKENHCKHCEHIITLFLGCCGHNQRNSNFLLRRPGNMTHYVPTPSPKCIIFCLYYTTYKVLTYNSGKRDIIRSLFSHF